MSPPLCSCQLEAAARALNRAADHFDKRAMAMDERVARWRKDHGAMTRPSLPRRCTASRAS